MRSATGLVQRLKSGAEHGPSRGFWTILTIFDDFPTVMDDVPKSCIAPREVVASKNGLRQSSGDALDSQHAYAELDS